jgi:hypothetical protein
MEIICKSCGLNSKNENDYVPRYDRKSSNKRRNICWVCHREGSKSVKRTGVKLETLSIVTRIFPVRIVE